MLENAGEHEQLTGARYSDQTFHFVPSRFAVNSVTFLSKMSGIHVVLSYSRSFIDVKNKWFEQTVNKLASKLIVYGVDGLHFAPETTVTRAEMTALLVLH